MTIQYNERERGYPNFFKTRTTNRVSLLNNWLNLPTVIAYALEYVLLPKMDYWQATGIMVCRVIVNKDEKVKTLQTNILFWSLWTVVYQTDTSNLHFWFLLIYFASTSQNARRCSGYCWVFLCHVWISIFTVSFVSFSLFLIFETT